MSTGRATSGPPLQSVAGYRAPPWGFEEDSASRGAVRHVVQRERQRRRRHHEQPLSTVESVATTERPPRRRAGARHDDRAPDHPGRRGDGGSHRGCGRDRTGVVIRSTRASACSPSPAMPPSSTTPRPRAAAGWRFRCGASRQRPGRHGPRQRGIARTVSAPTPRCSRTSPISTRRTCRRGPTSVRRSTTMRASCSSTLDRRAGALGPSPTSEPTTRPNGSS